jgi:hypothetical protein
VPLLKRKEKFRLDVKEGVVMRIVNSISWSIYVAPVGRNKTRFHRPTQFQSKNS